MLSIDSSPSTFHSGVSSGASSSSPRFGFSVSMWVSDRPRNGGMGTLRHVAAGEPHPRGREQDREPGEHDTYRVSNVLARVTFDRPAEVSQRASEADVPNRQRGERSVEHEDQ